MLNLYTRYFLGFLEPATPIMEGIIDFHNYIFFFLVLILVFVFTFMCNILLYFWYFFELPSNRWDVAFRTFMYNNNKVTHGTVLEVIWTSIPALILISIAFPSFSLLYSMDELMMPSFTLKVIGHQWYWSYEYTDTEVFIENYKSSVLGKKENKAVDTSVAVNDFMELAETDLSSYSKGLDFDSYMVPESDLNLGDRRMLEVTEAVVLPINTYIRILVSSADVLHSFAVPSLGLKVDAVPGRLNQLSVFIKRQGVFYGQCSEICGVSHGMMPITVRAVNLQDYAGWLLALSSK